jgi:putative transposase
MGRFARLVIPGCPHHIIKRGNRRQIVFFSDTDKKSYHTILKRAAARAGISIWTYCFMANHVHLIAVPEREDSLAKRNWTGCKKLFSFYKYQKRLERPPLAAQI